MCIQYEDIKGVKASTIVDATHVPAMCQQLWQDGYIVLSISSVEV